MKTSSGLSPTRNVPHSNSFRTTKSATTLLKPSGSAATPLPTPKRTNIKKSTTGALPTPTSILPPASLAGRRDRGRIYIMYGPADEVDSHPSGGSYERPMEEGGGETSTYPFEDWRYRYLEGIGQEVIIEFVDTCMCGDYHMTLDRSEKDALKYTPNAGLTLYEQMGMSSKADRFNGGGLEQLGRRADEFATCRQKSLTGWSSTLSCKLLRPSNLRIWKKSSTPS